MRSKKKRIRHQSNRIFYTHMLFTELDLYIIILQNYVVKVGRAT